MSRIEVTAAVAGEVGLVVEQPQHQVAIGRQTQGLHAGQIVGHGGALIRIQPVDLIPADLRVALMQPLPPYPRRLPLIGQAGPQGIHLGGG
ncbi:hypothetical protein D3C76_1275200 [compost metagenome]